MNITQKQLEAIRDFWEDTEIDEEWLLRHTEMTFNDYMHTIYITVDNMNEQEYEWLKGDNNER